VAAEGLREAGATMRSHDDRAPFALLAAYAVVVLTFAIRQYKRRLV
jgi:hypothetical protein